ncbi:MAG: RNA-binding protein [Bacteroidetes bacterium]|nr:MAG: RNA-binding protein [Bacteroidota bacterium]
MNLFVSNIDYKITEDELRALFEEYGEVKSVKILKDMEDQKPKGYGFVLMGSNYEGQKAIIRLNKRKINDRQLSVQEARPKPGEEPEKKERVMRPRRKRISKD